MNNSAQHKAANVIPEKIFIRKINITNAQVNGPEDPEATWEEVEIKINAATFFNQEIGCRVALSVDILKEDDDLSKQIKANFTIDFFLDIENLQDFKIDNNAGETQLDARLGATILGIVYSTARGIVYTRTAGTALQGVILPVIDPAVLLTNEIKTI